MSDLDRVLADRLGPHGRLRPGQREAIDALLAGDTLAVLATGTGKTLVYQVVQRLLDRPALVVSPTLSLMADQVAALTRSGTPADRLDSSRTRREREATLAAWRDSGLGVLLMSPEQLGRPDVRTAVAAGEPGLVVVDEAHCVSTWGEDFRPDYLGLGAALDALGRPRTLATTATASPATRTAIVAALGLRDPAVVVGNADRPELWLAARELPDEDAVTDAVRARVATVEQGSVIVYVATRRRTEELAAALPGAVAYHGGLATKPREAVETGFRAGDVRLVVATSAFGLGVDRPDVRLVVHADPTDDLDDYWQQAGRGGRDGEPAEALLLTRPDGYGLRRYFASAAGAGVADLGAVIGALQEAGQLGLGPLREAAGLSAARVRRAVNALLRVAAVTEDADGVRLASDEPGGVLITRATRLVDDLRQRQETGVDLVRRYAETSDCRRRLVLELLGESHPDPCGRCDTCAAGTATTADDRPYAVGTVVRHGEWGRGTVTGYEGDRMTVLFEHDGFRTLALALVESEGLLAPG